MWKKIGKSIMLTTVILVAFAGGYHFAQREEN